MRVYEAGLQHIPQAKQLIDNDLEQFVHQWRTAYDQGSIAAIDGFCQVLLRGGKRLRGILAMQSYYAHGGTDDSVALGAARVVELLQTYLLVLDDIADRSDTRRGGLSTHRLIERAAQQANMQGDTAHYGEAQAINAAQSAMHKAAQELLELPIPDGVVRAAVVSIHKNIEITGRGQMNDLYNEATEDVLDEAAIERVLTQKSAYYTFVNPLELGACLAGRKQLDASLHDYALHTGCAFQIIDDVIGTFGLVSETGKSTNDDIREGKMTLIAQYALTHASEEQRVTLKKVLGSVNASDEACNEVRRIFIATGAREYALQRVQWYAQQAHASLASNTQLDQAFISFLEMLIEYVTSRQT